MGRRVRDLGVRATILNRVPRKGHSKEVTFEYDNKDMGREEVNTLCSFWEKTFPAEQEKEQRP